jgi:hypothetical protein
LTISKVFRAYFNLRTKIWNFHITHVMTFLRLINDENVLFYWPNLGLNLIRKLILFSNDQLTTLMPCFWKTIAIKHFYVCFNCFCNIVLSLDNNARVICLTFWALPTVIPLKTLGINIQMSWKCVWYRFRTYVLLQSLKNFVRLPFVYPLR